MKDEEKKTLVTRPECKGCKYLGWTSGWMTCDYILIRYERRPCAVGECREAGVYAPAKRRGRPKKNG